jgi:hypothetical protein
VDITVHDPELLRQFAEKRYEECWSQSLDKYTPVGELLYESLIASNGTKESPLDYGIEINDWTSDELK